MNAPGSHQIYDETIKNLPHHKMFHAKSHLTQQHRTQHPLTHTLTHTHTHAYSNWHSESTRQRVMHAHDRMPTDGKCVNRRWQSATLMRHETWCQSWIFVIDRRHGNSTSGKVNFGEINWLLISPNAMTTICFRSLQNSHLMFCFRKIMARKLILRKR